MHLYKVLAENIGNFITVKVYGFSLKTVWLLGLRWFSGKDKPRFSANKSYFNYINSGGLRVFCQN